MAIPVVIEAHGAGAILSSDGKRVVLDSPAPAPPGASLSCAFGGLPPVRIKVSSCKRSQGPAAATFRIEGRFVDLTREQRAKLEAANQGSI